MTLSYTRRLHLAVPDFLSEPWHAEFAAAMDSIDSAIFTAIVGTTVELWENSHEYTIGALIIDPMTGTLFASSEDHTSSASLTFAEERLAFPSRWTSFAVDVASQAEAEEGIENTKYMTPLRTAQAIDALSTVPGIATEIDAVEGTSNAVVMTPLRTTQNVTARIATQAEAEAGTDNLKLMTPLRVAQAIDTIGLPGGATIAFSAHKNGTNQTGIASGTPTKITFGTELYDLGSHFDTANSRWTPPAGNCHIDAAVYVTAGMVSNTHLTLSIYKNGALFKSATIITSATIEGVQISADDVGNNTDYYELYLSQDSGSAATITGGITDSYFMGHFLGESTTVTLGAAEIGFFARLSTNVGWPGGVWQKLVYPSEVYDQGNFYDTTNGRWIPSAGMVSMTASFYQTGSPQPHIAIYKNGVQISGEYSRDHTSEGTCQVTTDDIASGSDYYEVFANLAGGAIIGLGQPATYFCGHRLGVGPTGATGATGATGPAGVDGTLITTVPSPPQGRLTLAPNTPIMATTVASATIIYYTPYVGSRIPIYNGTVFDMMDFVELSVATTDTTQNPFALGTAKVNDWFVWKKGANLVLTHSPNWDTDTTRPVGLALTRVKGIWLNTEQIGDGAVTGPAALRGTYVGTTRSDNSGPTISWKFGSVAAGGGYAWHGVWNCYNRVDVTGVVLEPLSQAWAVPPGIRFFHGSSNNSAQAVFGLAEDGAEVNVNATVAGAASGGWVAVSASLNTIALNGSPGTTYSGHHNSIPSVYGIAYIPIHGRCMSAPVLGHNVWLAWEYTGDGTGTNTTIFGNYGNGVAQGGLTYRFKM